MFKKILITAGPTREMLDPVRYLSNLSTGAMGYALAKAALSRGARVTLISGPTALLPPKGVKFIPVTSARDLEKACRRYFPKHDLLMMSAAVCDYEPHFRVRHKIPRSGKKQLILKSTPDIVAGLSRGKGKRCVIGFCLETRDWLRRAREKCRRKNLDGIVANYLDSRHVPFGDRTIKTAVIDRQGRTRILPCLKKSQLARRLLLWAEWLAKKDSAALEKEYNKPPH